ncbi:hypothetical protein, partial [Staphylococcus aureus]|uniref:hypothetical protein n=1 Tax=Staphylococcus aureus TaxID=1280 RepID=UPI0037DA28A9
MHPDCIPPSQGPKLSFHLHNTQPKLQLFTTTPHTIYPPSFLLLSPQHPLLNSITTHQYKQKLKPYQTQP